jgi:hypothetical protein
VVKNVGVDGKIILIDLQEVEWGWEWINFVQDRDRWWTVVNFVMDLGVP